MFSSLCRSFIVLKAVLDHLPVASELLYTKITNISDHHSFVYLPIQSALYYLHWYRKTPQTKHHECYMFYVCEQICITNKSIGDVIWPVVLISAPVPFHERDIIDVSLSLSIYLTIHLTFGCLDCAKCGTGHFIGKRKILHTQNGIRFTCETISMDWFIRSQRQPMCEGLYSHRSSQIICIYITYETPSNA